MKFDIAVIGGGPAGIAAAITAQSKGRKVVLFEAHGFSPRLRSVSEITDYLGLRPMSGTELMDHFVAHLSRTDVFVVEEKVVSLKEVGNGFVVGTPSGNFDVDAVVLCTGVSRSNLLVGEKEFMGRGVSYCAKIDGVKYKGKRVAAIATTDDAMDEIELLCDYCEHVYLFPRYSGFRPPKRKNITIVIEPPTEITGTDRVTGLHTDTDFFGVQAVFMFRATDPLNSFLPQLQIRGRSVYVEVRYKRHIRHQYTGQ